MLWLTAFPFVDFIHLMFCVLLLFYELHWLSPPQQDMAQRNGNMRGGERGMHIGHIVSLLSFPTSICLYECLHALTLLTFRMAVCVRCKAAAPTRWATCRDPLSVSAIITVVHFVGASNTVYWCTSYFPIKGAPVPPAELLSVLPQTVSFYLTFTILKNNKIKIEVELFSLRRYLKGKIGSSSVLHLRTPVSSNALSVSN